MITKKDLSTIKAYLEDSSNLSGGHAEEVVIPGNYEDLSSFLKEANDKKLPVTISGGGTGTSGGRIPFGGALLSTEKLNKIKDIKKQNSTAFAACQAGVLIKDLKFSADKEGFFYAYDPTEQTAFVGGTIATNASGARSFKYGSTRQSVYALTLALADGSIFSLERGNIKAKNNKIGFKAGKTEYLIPLPTYKMPDTKCSAGYYVKDGMDLIDLFIGQEGTLACILEAKLKLNRKPEDILSCFAFFKSEEDAADFAIKARDLSMSPADEINALSIEYFDSNSSNLLREKYGKVPSYAKACVFFEQEVEKKSEDKVIETWEGLITGYDVSLDNTWVAMSQKEREGLLDRRHWIGEAMNEMTKINRFPKVSTDLAVPHENFAEMKDYYKKVLSDVKSQYFLFGHIGDSHLHLTILPKDEKEYRDAKDTAMKFIRKSVSLGGTVSAEHGIGKLRREYLKVLYGERGIGEMVRVKKILDPNLILGRGNIFSEGELK